jgi:rRNA-processing protein FCF1
LASDRVGHSKVTRPLRVLFDSSFLIAVMERPTPWREDMLEKLGGFDAIVIDTVYDELVRLSESRNRASRYASVAKGMVDRGELRLEKAVGNGSADDELMSLALGGDALVATLDRELIRQLKASNVRVVSLSGGRVSL